MTGWRKKVSASLIVLMICSQAAMAGGKQEVDAAAAGDVNLAVGSTATASSGSAANAVDGKGETVWQPLAADRKDDMNVWLSIDLGKEETFNKVMFNLNRADNLKDYQLLYSNDQTNWNEAFSKNKDLSASETASFEAVSARYLKLSLIHI